MRISWLGTALLAISLPSAAAACGGSSGGTGGGAAASSTSGSGGGSSASGGGSADSATTTTTGAGGSAECHGPGYGGDEPSVTVGSVTVKLVDQNGSPAAGVPVFVCGTDICTAPATTDAAGAATISAHQALKAPAFKYGDGLEWAKFAEPVPAGDTAIGTVTALELPAIGTGDALSPGASAASNGVVIDVPEGGSVAIDELTYGDPDQQTFRAVLLPQGANAPAVDPSIGLDVVYGVAPMETELCPPAKLHVPNSAGWPAGAAVEVYLHGLDVGEEWAPYAGWAKVSEAQVSADGAEVVTSDGGGIPLLTTFGLRLEN